MPAIYYTSAFPFVPLFKCILYKGNNLPMNVSAVFFGVFSVGPFWNECYDIYWRNDQYRRFLVLVCPLNREVKTLGDLFYLVLASSLHYYAYASLALPIAMFFLPDVNCRRAFLHFKTVLPPRTCIWSSWDFSWTFCPWLLKVVLRHVRHLFGLRQWTGGMLCFFLDSYPYLLRKEGNLWGWDRPLILWLSAPWGTCCILVTLQWQNMLIKGLGNQTEVPHTPVFLVENKAKQNLASSLEF